MRNITSVLAFLSVVPLSNLSAQAAQPVGSLGLGQRARVSAAQLHSDPVIGRFEGLRRDTLYVAAARIPLAFVTLLERSEGKSQVPIIVGGLLGLAGGTAIELSISGTECLRSPDIFEPCDVTPEVGAALLGAVLGGTLGAALGAVIRRERWEEVPLDRLRASIVARRDGRFALGASIRFWEGLLFIRCLTPLPAPQVGGPA
jgi:hypothetical protein